MELFPPQAHVALTCLATQTRPHYAHYEPVTIQLPVTGGQEGEEPHW